VKYSLNWLKEFVDLPQEFTPDKMAERLLMLGFEVSDVSASGPDFENVVVAEVLEVTQHPNADRLRLCEVTDGTDKTRVVCGAPNVAKGQRIALARVGARLTGNFKIKKSKIRGEVSHGMICSGKELGVSSETEGILVLSPDAPLGADVAGLLGDKDTGFELEVTPNRPDVLSHLGLARELAWSLRLPLKDPLAGGQGPTEASGTALPFKIEEADACPRYLGRTLTGLKIGPSPSWLTRRLETCGLRPINNLVDITNYVLLERGHPLHVFDQDLIESGKLTIRRAKKGDKILALDDKTYRLDGSDLVIADGKRAAAIAGVIGGVETSVSEKTTTAFLECAYFDPAGIRHTARRLRIRTDSSYRFERGADPGGVPAASARAALLAAELCGAKSTPAQDDDRTKARPSIRLDHARMETSLGMEVESTEAEKILRGLDTHLEADEQGWTVHAPTWRPDLTIEADLCEEIARHVGYDRIPTAVSPIPATLTAEPASQAWLGTFRERLVGLGFFEAMTYDFLSEGDLADTRLPAGRRLANPISTDWVFLRPSLLPGLLRSLRHNLHRGADSIRLFESGKAFGPDGESAKISGIMAGPGRTNWASGAEPLEFAALKGVVETLFSGLVDLKLQTAENPDPHLSPKRSLRVFLKAPNAAGSGTVPVELGSFGQVHPSVLRAWDVPEAWYFEFDLERLPGSPPWSRRLRPIAPYPSSTRDLSIVLPEEVSWEEIDRSVRRTAGKDLEDVSLIDVFTGGPIPQGVRSLTLRLTLASKKKTLGEKDIQAAVERILKALIGLGASLRT